MFSEEVVFCFCWIAVCSKSNVNKLRGNACQTFELLILMPCILKVNRFSLHSFRLSLTLEKIAEF